MVVAGDEVEDILICGVEVVHRFVYIHLSRIEVGTEAVGGCGGILDVEWSFTVLARGETASGPGDALRAGRGCAINRVGDVIPGQAVLFEESLRVTVLEVSVGYQRDRGERRRTAGSVIRVAAVTIRLEPIVVIRL